MFKKVIYIIFFICMPVYASNNINHQYKVGVDFDIISNQITYKPEIRGFFSFWCGHCYMKRDVFFELQKIYKEQFVLNPIVFSENDKFVLANKAFAAAVILNVEKQFSEKMFKIIQVDRKAPKNLEDYTKLFKEIGIDKDNFIKTFNSSFVTMHVRSYKKAAKDSMIMAVPELIVNGRYRVNLSKYNNINEIRALIDYLLNFKI